jgi:hypothetical protein
MNQIPIDFDAARAAGESAANACERKARKINPEFTERAEVAILAHLHTVGQASGEVLTDVAIAHGARPHDARAFGSVFARLLRANRVFVVGYAPRRKGHGCMGAKVYALQH